MSFFPSKKSTSSVKEPENPKIKSTSSEDSLRKKGSSSSEKSLKRVNSKIKQKNSSTADKDESTLKQEEEDRPVTPPREVSLDHEELEMERVDDIVIAEREQSETGLWYPVKGGWIKAGDPRWGAPYITGRAEIRQVRNILKFCFMNLVLKARVAQENVKSVNSSGEVENKDKIGSPTSARSAQTKDTKEKEALASPRSPMSARSAGSNHNATSPLGSPKATEGLFDNNDEETNEEGKENTEIETEEQKQEREKAAKEIARRAALNGRRQEFLDTRFRVTVLLVKKSPKPRMTDVEEVGVHLSLDNAGSRKDGCFWVTDCEWEKPYLEQGLRRISNPLDFIGVLFVKRTTDKPLTDEPVILGYAPLDWIDDRLKGSDVIMGMKELKDEQMKSVSKPQAPITSLMSKFKKLTGISKEEDNVQVCDTTRLKPESYYSRLAENCWMWMKKNEDEGINFYTFKKCLDHLEFYMLEPRALRLFSAVDIDKHGKITVADFQVSLMMNDIIPSPPGLMPIDAFAVFDFEDKGEIDFRKFEQILKALKIEGTTEKFQEIFNEADEDDGGWLDYSEFKNIFVKLVNLNDEFDKRDMLDRMTKSMRREKKLQKFKTILEDEEWAMIKAFGEARQLVLDFLMKKRLERDEIKRKKKEELIEMKRIEKLSSSYQKQEKKKQLKKEQSERAKNRIEEKLLKNKLAADEAILKKKKAEEIAFSTKEKERVRLKQISQDNLDKANFRNMGLKEIPDEIYGSTAAESRLDVLLYLDLSENKLSELPDESFFYWMSSLRELNLAHNRLEELPSEIGNLANLELLTLNDNTLTTLPPSIGQLKKLKAFNISKNKLKELPWDVGGLESLQVFNLHSNFLYDLPPTLNNCHELTRLDLGDNRIRYLPDTLCKLFKLQDLDLSINNISYLPAALGEDLFNLVYLDISFNSIGELPKSFVNMNQLNVFNGRHNEIQYLGEYITGWTNIVDLNLSSNLLQNIHKGIGKLTRLQRLNLSSNRIESLPIEIGFLQDCQRINLRRNLLKVFLPEIGALRSISYLDLSLNEMKGPLPTEFGMLVCAKTVLLNNNYLEAFPDSVGNLKKIQTLNVSHNQFTFLPQNIQGCQGLENLDLSCNKFTRFPHILYSIPVLQYVNMRCNLISKLPKDIDKIAPTLKEFNLDRNQLKSVPTAFSLIAKRAKVTLDSNPFTDLPPKWNARWTPHEAATSWSGYTSWDVIKWAHEEHLYYDACMEEWEHSGTLHFEGKASMEDFIYSVQCRLGNKWYKRYRQGIIRLYTAARTDGVIPRMYQTNLAEQEELEILKRRAKKVIDQKMALVDKDMRDRADRMKEAYGGKDESKEEMLARMRDKFRAALVKQQERANITRMVKKEQHHRLLQDVKKETVRQENQSTEMLRRDMKTIRDEMDRMLVVARRNKMF